MAQRFWMSNELSWGMHVAGRVTPFGSAGFGSAGFGSAGFGSAGFGATAVLCLLVLASACGDDGAASRDLSSVDKPSLTFRDSGRRDGGPPHDLSTSDGPLDARSDGRDGALGDAWLDGPAADLLAADAMPPDITSPDTVAHLCTAFGEFTCTPSSFIVRCNATCTDHLGRQLLIRCVGTSCSCQVNGATQKTCGSGATKCTACQQAFSCCAF